MKLGQHFVGNNVPIMLAGHNGKVCNYKVASKTMYLFFDMARCSDEAIHIEVVHKNLRA